MANTRDEKGTHMANTREEKGTHKVKTREEQGTDMENIDGGTHMANTREDKEKRQSTETQAQIAHKAYHTDTHTHGKH